MLATKQGSFEHPATRRRVAVAHGYQPDRSARARANRLRLRGHLMQFGPNSRGSARVSSCRDRAHRQCSSGCPCPALEASLKWDLHLVASRHPFLRAGCAILRAEVANGCSPPDVRRSNTGRSDAQAGLGCAVMCRDGCPPSNERSTKEAQQLASNEPRLTRADALSVDFHDGHDFTNARSDEYFICAQNLFAARRS